MHVFTDLVVIHVFTDLVLLEWASAQNFNVASDVVGEKRHLNDLLWHSHKYPKACVNYDAPK